MNLTIEKALNYLRGVFQISDSILKNEPLFLLDDAINSGWTVTVISKLLKEKGAGNIYPIALTTTGKI